ncbi:hypothetical protein SCRES1_gp60 [Synechococcus phage S-CRES1]|nr:hypothetical protein SCRES1_gp60 [Synechococcus phage S-CRES1]
MINYFRGAQEKDSIKSSLAHARAVLLLMYGCYIKYIIYISVSGQGVYFCGQQVNFSGQDVYWLVDKVSTS